jgi:hypothetical protein
MRNSMMLFIGHSAHKQGEASQSIAGHSDNAPDADENESLPIARCCRYAARGYTRKRNADVSLQERGAVVRSRGGRDLAARERMHQADARACTVDAGSSSYPWSTAGGLMRCLGDYRGFTGKPE